MPLTEKQRKNPARQPAKRCARSVRRFILKIDRKKNSSWYEESNLSYDETVRKMSFVHCSFLKWKLLSAQL